MIPMKLNTSPVFSVMVIVMLAPSISPVMVPVTPQSGGPISEEICMRVDLMVFPVCTIAMSMYPPLPMLGTSMLPDQLPELSAGGGGGQSWQVLKKLPQLTVQVSKQHNIAALSHCIALFIAGTHHSLS
jgi:hypothetical protein